MNLTKFDIIAFRAVYTGLAINGILNLTKFFME